MHYVNSYIHFYYRSMFMPQVSILILTIRFSTTLVTFPGNGADVYGIIEAVFRRKTSCGEIINLPFAVLPF